MTTSGVETEIKLCIPDIAAAENRLRDLGFSASHPREFEANILYDRPGADLRHAKMLLRLRQFGTRGVLTWKGPPLDSGTHKQRPERETVVESVETTGFIFEQLGFFPQFRYEKYRTEYTSPDPRGIIVLDETPIGLFLELEGESPWIDETAAALGFEHVDYILESYGALYLRYCEKNGLQPSHMVFSSEAV